MKAPKISVRIEDTFDGRLRAHTPDGRLAVEAEEIGELRRRLEVAILALYGEPRPVSILVHPAYTSRQ